MILDDILKQKTNTLKLFNSEYINILLDNVIEKEDKYFVKCLVRNKNIQISSKSKTQPEEVIRQLYILKLNKKYGYPVENMSLEVDVKMGSSHKSADIIIYDNPNKKDKENIILIVEIKKPKEKLSEGIAQVESYVSALPAYLGIWTDGVEENIRYRNPSNKYNFERFKRVPKYSESIEDVLQTYLTKKDLINITDLKSTVVMLEQKVLSNDGVNAFDEIFKLIFAKLYDEKTKKKKDDILDFQIKIGSKIQKTIRELFKNAKNKWKDVFKEKDEIELSEETLVEVISELQEYKLFETDFEILDSAFEHMISGDSKGEKGQYFTPRPIIDIMVQMLNPQEEERVLDPSAGSAGFLLHTFQYMLKNEKIDEAGRYEYASKQLFALDFDPRTVKIAKALMVIAGDGASNCSQTNSLDLRQWDSEDEDNKKYNGVLESKFKNASFNILMSNPPFAGDIKDSSGYLGYYDVAKDKKLKTKSKQSRDILFIERNLKFLESGGRMGIVLPQGRFNNSSDKELRDYISKECRILGVIGLHGNSFKPYTGTKTSILLVQKWDDELCPKKEDYPMFFATNIKPVKNNSGLYIGNSTTQTLEKTDLPQIAQAFEEFAKKENLSFSGK